jgi:hypothetical protein
MAIVGSNAIRPRRRNRALIGIRHLSVDRKMAQVRRRLMVPADLQSPTHLAATTKAILPPSFALTSIAAEYREKSLRERQRFYRQAITATAGFVVTVGFAALEIRLAG